MHTIKVVDPAPRRTMSIVVGSESTSSTRRGTIPASPRSFSTDRRRSGRPGNMRTRSPALAGDPTPAAAGFTCSSGSMSSGAIASGPVPISS